MESYMTFLFSVHDVLTNTAEYIGSFELLSIINRKAKSQIETVAAAESHQNGTVQMWNAFQAERRYFDFHRIPLT